MPDIENGMVVESGLQNVIPLRDAIAVGIMFGREPVPEELCEFWKNVGEEGLVLSLLVIIPSEAGQQRRGEKFGALAAQSRPAINETIFVLNVKKIFDQAAFELACGGKQAGKIIGFERGLSAPGGRIICAIAFVCKTAVRLARLHKG